MRHLIQFLAVGMMFAGTGAVHGDIRNELLKYHADDGVEGDRFGFSVAMSGTTAIVGAPGDDDNGEDSGSVYLFDMTTGQQVAKLTASDGAMNDGFGASVAISGNIAIVNAAGNDDFGEDSGSAYLFDITTGRQIAKLLPNDGAAHDYFGSSIAISGAIAIVGAITDDDNGEDSGSAYLFDTATGQQIVKLLPEDGSPEDWFGISVAIDGTTAIVAAPRDDDNGVDSGAVYLFDASTGEQIGKLVPDDAAAHDYFGYGSVALDGTTAVIGMALDDDNGRSAGAAYIFDTATHKQSAKLLADDEEPTEGDRFGLSVSIDGNTAIVGARNHIRDSGVAYLFDTTTGEQIAKLLPSFRGPGFRFGSGVAISGNDAIVGAYNARHDNPEFSGVGYLFDAGSSPGTPATLTNFNIATGDLLGGDLPELESSNDSYVHARSGVGVSIFDLHHTEMIVDAVTGVATPTTLDVTIESRIDEPAGIMQIRLMNWNMAAFTHIGQFPIGSNDELLIIRKIGADGFVNAQGDIQLSIKHIVFVPFRAFTFESWFDFVEVIVR